MLAVPTMETKEAAPSAGTLSDSAIGLEASSHVAPTGSPIARFILFLLALCGLVSTVQAGVRFDVFFGYEGYVPEASWFPVVCEVNNDGPSFTATVEISPGQNNQGQDRRIVVELPTGTTKRFVIPVFSSSRAGAFAIWDARLLDEKGRERATQLGIKPRKLMHWRIPIMAAVSRSPIPLPNMDPNPGQMSPDWQPVIGRLPPNVFPDNPITLEGLSTVYLNAERALDLKVNQVNALLAWLYQGGHLVVGVEQPLDVNGNEWLRQLLPCTLTGLTNRQNHSDIQDWLRSARLHTGKEYPFEGFVPAANPPSNLPSNPPPASGARPRRTPPPRPQNAPLGPVLNPYVLLPDDDAFEKAPLQMAVASMRDGTPLIGSAEYPLAVIARRGRGQITVLLFSPEIEPFLSYKNRSHFWAKILGVPPELFQLQQLNKYAGSSLDGVLGSLIETTQVRKLPVGWLLLLLLGYLVVIGPLDRYWLKKINRPMLTWLTFPAYVAGFSILIYLIGYKLRAGETEWNELHMVDIIPVGERAELRGRTFASIYSPANARYQLASDQPCAALRGEYQRGQESSKATVESQGNSFSAEVAVPVWTSQLYVGDWLRRDEPPLTFSVTSDALHYYLRVTNKMDKVISEARLAVGGYLIPVPSIPPKEDRQFTLARNSGDNLPGFVQRYSGSFQNMIQQRQQAFGGNERSWPITNSVLALSFISQYNPQSPQKNPLHDYAYGNAFITTPGLDLSPLVARGDAVLLAWVPNYSLTKPLNKFSPRRIHRDTLLRLSAEVKPLKAEN